jgi:enolase-phosphatase E1
VKSPAAKPPATKLVAVRGVLLDIEGTTSSISFVHDVMFPYVRQHLAQYLDRHWSDSGLDQVRQQLARDDGADDWQAWLERQQAEPAQGRSLAEQQVLKLMDGDVKATGLKTLQGLIWDSGFRSGALKSHVYPDVLPAIALWREQGIDVRIYSSGSIAAQRLFFGHVDGHGDCLHLFSGHYDTTIGNKREAASYARIAADWGLEPAEIVFVSDLAAELEAASAAGLQAVASIRPGNASLPAAAPWPRIESFAELAPTPP